MKKSYLIISLLLMGLFLLILSAAEIYTARPEFCGTCHIMKKFYKSWEESRHNETACVDCHYAPGEKTTIKAKLKGLSQLFSYLATGDSKVKKRATIDDESCLMEGCHPRESFLEKRLAYTEKISFVHETHEKETIEGQILHCNTCHIHVNEARHFEVPKETCYLCHFKNEEFNQGRGACTLCHIIPTTPLQKQKKLGDENVITHQSLEKNKVPCLSCHLELIKGTGEIKTEDCKECHDDEEALDHLGSRKLMHEAHVSGQQANCLNCHQPIRHEALQFVDTIISNCSNCHPDHHDKVKRLLRGTVPAEESETPALMFAVKTNCLGCHRNLSLKIPGAKKL